MMTLRMTLPGGIVLNGQSESVVHGFYIGKGDFDWFDSVGVRRNEVDRPQGHGAFDLPGFLGSRTSTVTGFCVARSQGELDHMGSSLKGVLAGGESGRVTVDWDGVYSWADMRLSGTTRFAIDRQNLVAGYQISLWAANPRKFGNTLSFAGGVPSYHYGNFIAAPVHTVTGSMGSGYTITGPSGKTFTVTQPVVDGSPHVIDMGTGYLSINGVVIAGGVSDGTTWGVPAGGQVTQTLTPVAGTGTLSTSVQDTYV